MSTTQPTAIALQIADNAAWTPGSVPFTITVNPDFGDAPTLNAAPDGIINAILGPDEGGVYTGTLTAIGVGTATLSLIVEGETTEIATVTVTELFEGVTVAFGAVVPPAAPAGSSAVTAAKPLAVKTTKA